MEQEGNTLADYIAIVKRRFTIVMASFIAVLIVGVYVGYSLPATYRSTGTIAIQPQNISADFVQTTVTTLADEQIDLVGQRVMSTASLSKIVEKFGLFPGASNADAVAALRANTFLERQDAAGGDPRRRPATIAFALSYDAFDPVIAQQIAQELADLYLAENAASRNNQTQLTVEFVQASIESARRDLDKASDELAQFKELHAGNLPELLNFHLASIDRTEQQLDNLNGDVREARNRQFTLETTLLTTNPLSNAVDEKGVAIMGTADRLAFLQNEKLRLLSIYTAAHPAVINVEREIATLTGSSTGAASAAGASSAPALRAQLETVLTDLRTARQKYAEDHPDVVRLARSEANLRAQLDVAEAAANGSATLSSLNGLASRDPAVQQLNAQIETEKSYIRTLMARQRDLESKLEDSRRKVAEMPQIEREYQVLVRDSELANTRYNEAVAQLDTAQRARTLETEGSGNRFSLLEAPLLPTAPYKPNRAAIVMLVVLLAGGLGVAVALLIDNLDEALKGAKQLAELTGAPPLAVIPFLETPSDRRRRLTMTVAKSTALVGGLATAAGIAVIMG